MADLMEGAVTMVNIAGTEIPYRDDIDGDESALVPQLDKHYSFPEITSDVILDLIEGKRIALTGHTGTGKTSMFYQIASRINQPVLRANLNGQTTVSDFIGLWTVRGGEMIWLDGVLPHAMKNGYWLILDEMDFAESYILALLNSVLEPGGVLTLKEKGSEIVRPHPNFRLVATANTMGVMQSYRSLYQGTNIFNEAMLDRWRVYLINYLPADKEAEVLSNVVDRMNIRITQVLVKVANLIREAFEKEEVQCTFSFRRLIDWASMMVRHRDPLKAAENTIFSKISQEDAEIIKGIIQRIMKVTT